MIIKSANTVHNQWHIFHQNGYSPLFHPEIDVLLHYKFHFLLRICSEIAEHCTNQNELEKAVKFYKEALVYSENDSKAMLELSRLYMSQGELDQCQHQLVKLLQIGTDTDAATVVSQFPHLTVHLLISLLDITLADIPKIVNEGATVFSMRSFRGQLAYWLKGAKPHEVAIHPIKYTSDLRTPLNLPKDN